MSRILDWESQLRLSNDLSVQERQEDDRVRKMWFWFFIECDVFLSVSRESILGHDFEM
jgi:hypothetical protein